jgi:trehalose 6-phosphate phosphatase
MGYILARRHRAALMSFASSNVLVVFDYDGTLAPIAPTPGRARMRVATRQLLTRAAALYPCVVISGRSLADLNQRLAGVPLWSIAGNHGLEPWDASRVYAARVRGWASTLSRRLSPHDGVVIEDKRYSVAVHYRNARNRRAARRQIDEALTSIRGARVVGGRAAVNLVPRGAPHKGVALERLRRLFACDAAIYVGDDETDEDAFQSGPSSRLLSIRVGRNGRTHADYHLKNQREIDELLKVLVSSRERPDSAVRVRGAAAV